MRVVDWNEELAADGTQSRIGDAVRNILTDHDPSTLAGTSSFLTDEQWWCGCWSCHCGRQMAK